MKNTSQQTSEALLNVMEDLEVEKAKAEAIIASICDGLVVVGENMRVTLVNEAVEKLTGWCREEIIGRGWQEVIELRDKNGSQIRVEESPLFLAIHEQKMTSATINTYFYTRKDRTTFPVAITVSSIRLGSEQAGAVIAFRDITREQEIDKAKSEFVSLASHQLRTPLGIVKWYLEALENEDYIKQAPKEVRNYFKEIYKSNERVLGLMRDLLSVSRIEQGRVKNEPKLVDVGQQIGEIVDQLQTLAGEKKITLSLIEPDVKILPIRIDELRLHEVMENLIANGIEYSEVGGVVGVSLEKVDGTVVMKIKDNGIGISAADQKRLFTKFFRSEKAIGYNQEGSGLGLYLVKSYVEGWGGKISVESREGQGSIFTVSIPILQK